MLNLKEYRLAGKGHAKVKLVTPLATVRNIFRNKFLLDSRSTSQTDIVVLNKLIELRIGPHLVNSMPQVGFTKVRRRSIWMSIKVLLRKVEDMLTYPPTCPCRMLSISTRIHSWKEWKTYRYFQNGPEESVFGTNARKCTLGHQKYSPYEPMPVMTISWKWQSSWGSLP